MILTGGVIPCGFTRFGGLSSTLPNQVKLSRTCNGIPGGRKHTCISTAITVFVSGDCLDVAQPGRTAQICSTPALFFTMLRWTFQHHRIDSARFTLRQRNNSHCINVLNLNSNKSCTVLTPPQKRLLWTVQESDRLYAIYKVYLIEL